MTEQVIIFVDDLTQPAYSVTSGYISNLLSGVSQTGSGPKSLYQTTYSETSRCLFHYNPSTGKISDGNGNYIYQDSSAEIFVGPLSSQSFIPMTVNNGTLYSSQFGGAQAINTDSSLTYTLDYNYKKFYALTICNLAYVNNRGNWSASTRYIPNDLVVNKTSSYVSLTNNMSDEPPSSSWLTLSPSTSSQWKGEWNNTTSYVLGDMVSYRNNVYISSVDNKSKVPFKECSWCKLTCNKKPFPYTVSLFLITIIFFVILLAVRRNK